jgi:hypothetical protein
MKKILDIFIIVLLTILVMNLFTSKKEQNNIQDNILFKSIEANYTIPALV